MKETGTVIDVIRDIQNTRTQVSANARDELRVAQAMLNDPTYSVDIYGKTGVIATYCPYEETRGMIASILKDTTHISTKEATELANGYSFDKNTAEAMIHFSKEFISTYTQTGRKLPLGCRATSNVALIAKHKEPKESSYPVPTPDGNGNTIYNSSSSITPGYDTLKAIGTCPVHVKNNLM